MKKIFIFLTLCLSLLLRGFTANVSVAPAEPIAGENFAIQIRVDSSGDPEFSLPQIPGIELSRRISFTSRNSLVNGKMKSEAIYGINARADKPGKYTIAPFEITIKDKKVRTRAVEFIVADPQELVKSGDHPQAQLVIIPDRKIYSGETARAVIRLQMPEKLDLNNVHFRESGFGNAVFSRRGPERQKWVLMQSRRSKLYEFAADFQLPHSGEFYPEVKLTLQTVEQDNNDPFGGFFPRVRTREITVSAAAARPLKILPRPQPPQDAENINLTGNWQITMSVPPNAVFKTGDVAEIALDITGSAPLNNFHAPKLSFPNARVYPPEVQVRANGCSVKYIFVPLAPGTHTVKQIFAVFDPEKGVYRKEHCSVTFRVLPGTVNAAAGTPLPAAGGIPEVSPAAESKIKAFPVYPLPPRSPVLLPLWENRKWQIIFFTLAGAVMLLISFIRFCFSHGRPEETNRRRQLRKFAALLKKSDDPAGFLRQHGVAEIAAALGLPAGATAEDIAAETGDDKLQKFFHDLNASGFRPGGGNDRTNPDDIKKKLLKLLKKALLILIIFSAFPASAKFSDGRAAFDRGDHTQAAKIFRQMIDPSAPDPCGVYNFGCPLYMLGDYPRATLAFEQALLLNPRDARLKAAYHDSLAKLSLPAAENDGSLKAFILSLRDHFRPDDYLLAASIAFALLGVWSLCRKLPGKKYIMLCTGAIIVLALAAAWSQSLHRYSPDRARIITARAELHRIPADNGSVAGIISGGSEVKIAERNGHWVRIVLPDASGGWVKSDEIQEVFKHGLW